MRRAFRPLRLDLDKLAGQRVGKPRDDFILHIEQICDGLVEALGPKMVAGFGVDQLHVHPETAAASLYRAFERIADIQLAPYLPHVDRFALVRESAVTRDHERAADA